MRRLNPLFLAIALSCGSPLAFGEEAAPAASAPADARQHFLTPDELQRMSAAESAGAAKLERWFSDRLQAANYSRLIVDPVVYHPVPTPDAQVSQKTLDDIAAHLTAKQTEKLGSRVSIVTDAAPSTMRLSTAITGVSVKTEGMKPYEVMPAAAVFGLMKNASGNRKQDVKLFIETRLVDASSGELLGVTMREVQGKDLKGKKDALQVDDVAPALAEALDTALQTLSERGF